MTPLLWRKSSYSSDNGGNCLEIATNLPGVVPVRDSKVPEGPALMLAPAAWTAFVVFASSTAA
ncbi:DUF397 domain-containing protein [Streptomyces liangshanensis]|uniref:DUF397 domain-containing protein n=1 Tax=Streptomyces liangshanensis TaxID=2717324 RepID=A0A6G9H165_9ACTN|nr:DUF397 domain-containing protein [Streptomyces liangshanensis]QIQ04282.1 DUF397 domain-containing protein [Streptomyces liangshanensis]